MIDPVKAIKEDICMHVGLGVTESVGSDSYPYYVSEMLPKGVIGLCRPRTTFRTGWTEGTLDVEPFDVSMKTVFYIKRRYGNWWKVTPEGKPICRYSGRYHHISFGHAYGYRDPSF
jgi:hypothetical protein